MQKIKIVWDVLLCDWAITDPVVGLISLPKLPFPSLTFLFRLSPIPAASNIR